MSTREPEIRLQCESEYAQRRDLARLTPAEFDPQRAVELTGILIVGQRRPRAAAALCDIALDALTTLVGQVIGWSVQRESADARFGDYRFMILSAELTDGPATFVQIWSEPDEPIVMEVSTGPRENGPMAAIPEALERQLRSRGFEWSDASPNWRKTVAGAPDTDALRIAHELLGTLVDLFAYQGTVDLAYELRQGTRLKPRPVMSGMTPAGLRQLLKAWGFACHSAQEDPVDLAVWSESLPFQAQLAARKQPAGNEYWEAHFSTSIACEASKQSALIERINSRIGLIKAWHATHPEGHDPCIGVATSVNFSGGVTVTHLRDHLFEFLSRVRAWRAGRAEGLAS